MSGRRHRLCVFMPAAALVGALLAPPGLAAADDRPPVDRVLMLSLPGVSYRNLDLERLPNLAHLLDESAVANLSVRGVRRRPTLGDGYVTIGAGTRSVGRTLDEGECFSGSEPFEEGIAREAMARRAGIAVAGISETAVVCLAQPAIATRNDNLLFDAEIGGLGDALAAAGVHRAVIANADRAEPTGTAGYFRMAGLALADSNGVVPGGTVSQELLTRDPAAPFGVRAAPEAFVAAFDANWIERSVVLVEASDLVRFDAYRSSVAKDARDDLELALLESFDALVGELLQRVDAERDAVLVVGPAHMGGTARLTMAGLRAPGRYAGELRSAYTRRTGVVSIVDIAPTILDLLGLERTDDMEGRPFEAVRSGASVESRVGDLAGVDEAARFRDGMISKVTTWFVVLQVLLTLAALVVSTRFARGRAAVEICALGLLGFLPATYLAGVFPFHEWGAALYWCFLLGVGAAIGAAAWLFTDRRGITTLIAALVVVVGVLVVDVVSGARLQFNTSLGYSPTVAGRFAGLGNLAYAQLAAATLLLAGLVAFRVGGRRGAWIAVGLLGLAIIVDGAPFWGADVGGVLSLVPAYAFTATMLLGGHLRWRHGLLYGGGTVALVALFAAFDASRPEDDRTHLGRLVHDTSDGGWDHLSTVLERKMSANLDVLFSSVWTVMLPIVLAGIAYLVYRAPGRMRGILARIPPLRAALAGLAVLAVLGFALNDSGIAVPGVMLGVATPVLVVVTMRGDRVPDAPRVVHRDSSEPELVIS
ncbi:MAG: hypothetical protein ACT4OX_07155 [Actinomycetota bacterium]